MFGVLKGLNPLNDEDAPLPNVSVFLLQLIIIMILCRILTFGLGYLKQPPVAAEIIAGILLGPTVSKYCLKINDQ